MFDIKLSMYYPVINFAKKKTIPNSHLFWEETKSCSTGIARHISCANSIYQRLESGKCFKNIISSCLTAKKMCILSWDSFESPFTKELHKGKRLPSLITDGIDRQSCLVHGSEWKQMCLRVLEFINTIYSQHVYWSDIDTARIVADQF